MRRLSLLFLGLAIVLIGQQIAASGQAESYLLRDGLIVSAIGALIFALAAPTFPRLLPPSDATPWPRHARIIFGAGVLSALLGGALFAVGEGGALLASARGALWLLGVGLILVGIFWPAFRRGYSLPAYRWRRDAAGRFVRMALEGDAPAEEERARTEQLYPLLLLGLVLIGALLRMWQLTELPASCVGDECLLGIRLADDGTGFGLVGLLTSIVFRVTGDALASLRMSSALIGVLTLPAFYVAARTFTRAGGALLTTAILALLPWHIWASRTSDPWIVSPLLISVVLWATGRGLSTNDRRWWTVAGIALGLLLADVEMLRPATALWAGIVAVLGAVAAQRDRESSLFNRLRPLLAPLIMLLLALPILAGGDRTEIAVGATLAWNQLGASAAELLVMLASRNPSLLVASGATMNGLLLGGMTLALAILGLGYQLRAIRRLMMLLALGGALLVAAGLARMDPNFAPPESRLLPLLPFLLLWAALAADTLLLAFQETWRALIAPSRVVVYTLAVVLIAGSIGAIRFYETLGAVQNDEQESVQAAMGRYLAERLRAEDAAPARYFVPPRVLDLPSTRLLAGDLLENGVAQTLEPAKDLPYTGAPDADLVYLVPFSEPLTTDLLAQFYPDGSSELWRDNEEAPPLFTVYTVTRQQVEASQGLHGAVFAGDALTTDQPPVATTDDGPLQFGWQADPPVNGPFRVQWQGSLLAPAAGNFVFAVQTGDPEAIISLRLDDELILDTSLGLNKRDYTLAEGAYRIDLSYRTSQPPGDWAITWQRPGGETEVVPRNVLRTPAAPNMGLLGTYYAGDQFQGSPVTVRKDLIIAADSALPWPYSVQWQGKLAAARSGEYLLSVIADGFAQIYVDNQLVVEQSPASEGPVDSTFTEGSIYLDQGWRDISVLFAPQSVNSELRLLWQPPGASAGALPSRQLTPVLADLFGDDLELPPAPPLLDTRLGDDDFALRNDADLRQPQIVVPPDQLTPLLPELLWELADGCGAGDGQFDWPHGVDMDPANQRIFVADTGNRRMVELDFDGRVNATYGQSDFEEPFDVAVTSDGDALLLDSVAQRIYRIAPETKRIAEIKTDTGFYRPRGLAVNDADHIFVADTGGGRVAMLDAEGRYLVGLGGPETGLGKGQPVDVLANADSGWAVTAEDGRIWRLDNNGSIAAAPRSSTLDGPHLAGLPDGSFFMTDPTRRTIFYYSKLGQPLGRWAYSDAFELPVGVAAGVTEGGRFVQVAVTDSRACALSLWRIPTATLASLGATE